MGDLRELEAAGRQDQPVLGRGGRLRDRRSRLRPASRARPDAALEHPRLDSGRPRHRLVSQAGVRVLMLQLFGHPFSSYTWKVLIPLYADGTEFEFRQVPEDQETY